MMEEIEEVCKKHGFAIVHEDHQGSFLIVPYDQGSTLDDAEDWT